MTARVPCNLCAQPSLSLVLRHEEERNDLSFVRPSELMYISRIQGWLIFDNLQNHFEKDDIVLIKLLLDIDDCAVNTCKNSICVDKINDYDCVCSSGFTGKNCETGKFLFISRFILPQMLFFTLFSMGTLSSYDGDAVTKQYVQAAKQWP